MHLVDDAIHKDYLIEQLQHFMQGRRVLLSKSCGDNNAIATAFDAGYLACLSELEYIILHPAKDQDKEIDEDEDGSENDEEQHE